MTRPATHAGVGEMWKKCREIKNKWRWPKNKSIKDILQKISFERFSSKKDFLITHKWKTKATKVVNDTLNIVICHVSINDYNSAQ